MSLVDMNTEVDIQVNKRKKVNKEAMVVEAFKEKYIKVDIVDEGNLLKSLQNLVEENTSNIKPLKQLDDAYL